METPLITGKLTGRLGPYGKPLTRRDGPYGKGQSFTGRAGVPYGAFTEKDDEEAYGKAGPLREAPYREERSLREGPVLTGRAGSFLHIEKDDETYRLYGAFCGNDVPTLRGPLRADRLTGKPYLTGRAGPYGKGRGPLRGWVPSQRRTTFNYRKAYGKLRGGTLPELGGNFRLCAVDQKKFFFLGLGRFWTFCPLRDLSPLQGPLRADRLTGRPLTGRLLTKRPLRGGFTGDTGKFTGPYGKPLTRRDGPYGKGRSLTGRAGSLKGPSQRRTTKRLTGRQGPYGKPLGTLNP